MIRENIILLRIISRRLSQDHQKLARPNPTVQLCGKVSLVKWSVSTWMVPKGLVVV